MRIVLHLAAVVAMLVAPALLGQKNTGPGSAAPDAVQARLLEHKESRFLDPVADATRRDAFRRTAEANALKASALRHRQTSKDFAAAIALLRESTRLFRAGGWNGQAADAYIQIGEVYFITSKYQQALSSFRQALTLAGSDPDRRAKALSRMARTCASTGVCSEADSYSQEALQENQATRQTHAEALEARGEAIYWSGDFPKAVEPLRQARDLFAEAKDDDGQALALLMLAWSHFYVDSHEALRLATEALRLWSANGNDYGVAQARALLGTRSAYAGQFETARCNCESALKTFQRTGDKDSAAVALQTLGFASWETGDKQQSFAHYQQSRKAFASAQDYVGEASAITGMGRALAAMERNTELLPLYRAKLHLAQRAKNALLVASSQVDIAGVYQPSHQYARAETLYLAALQGYRRARHAAGEGNVLISLARLYAAERKYSLAVSYLELARPLKEKAGQVEELAKIDYELANIYRSQGRLEESLRAIRRTIDIIESQRLDIWKFDSRASYFASVHKYYSLYVQVLMLLHRQDPQRDFSARALEASEKGKVRSLLDWLAGSQAPEPSCDEVLRHQAQMTEASEAMPAASKVASPTASDPTLSLKEVQAEIADDDTVLLEYALGDEKSYLWAVNRQRIVSYDLPEEKHLQEIVRGLRTAVMARELHPTETNLQYTERIRQADKDYRRYTTALSRVLLGPLQLEGAKRIIVIPEGSLQYVPFAALYLRKASGDRAVLAADHEVVTLPSASALSAIRKAVSRRTQPTAVAAVFADPVFEPDRTRTSPGGGGSAQRSQDPAAAARGAWRGAHPGSGRIPRLLASREEADAIRKNLGPDGVFVAEDFDATKEIVLRHRLADYRIVHFATHGMLDENHPEQSGLILSLIDSKGQPQDGYLRLGDIYNLKLAADLVVLSSCESALGKDLSSEGIIGLQRAFLRAGAKSVIATLWKVDDEATAALMTRFYVHLGRGENPASALRNSQRELASDKDWAEPYYWASFVLQGDYR